SRATEGGWRDDVAFLVGDRSFTHADVHDAAARTGALLAAAGVGPGERVLIALPDGIEFVWAFVGAVRIGAVAVPVNPRLTEADHRRAAAGAAAVVCATDLAGRFAGRVLVAEDLEDAIAGQPPAPAAPVTAEQAAYAQFTSGTTGTPKEARHGHGHPPVYVEAFARQAINIRSDDVLLSVSKLYFAYGLGNSLFFPLLTGCRAVLHAGHPRPDEIAEVVARHRVTVLFSVPTFFAHLVAGGRRADMASVRVAVSAGEALGVELAQRARAFFGCPILDGIGSTEVGQTFASNTLSECRDGTVGRALPPYRVEVRDGVLWVAGPTLPLDHAGEWLCTGDRAVVDGDGFLHLQGRVDDVEQVGGISVSPLEIEAVLCRHPAVTEVAVAGVVDAEGASRLEAFVVAGGPPGDLEAELIALARAELAPFKVPRAVHLVDALPRTPTGKLRRFVLRQANRST
ncbi:MAG TPA: AMP-binding protein, partial [Acidimicrobiales bacterium]|nr:AMP-binding protein [Acidimicrobiales bacterium]